MPATAEPKLTNPLTGDEVPKVDDAIAIGEDLAFQERWWKFERAIWIFFLLLLVADVLGVFGRGWLAKAKLDVPESGMIVEYERVARASTPSVMRIRITPSNQQVGTLQLFASESLVRELGTQRVIPQPQSSTIGNGGITYTFPIQSGDAEVQLALEPSFPGVHRFTLRIPGRQPASASIVVVP
jgi:hypothetical protein